MNVAPLALNGYGPNAEDPAAQHGRCFSICSSCLKKSRAPLAYLAMRILALSLIALLSIINVAWPQGSPTPPAMASGLPMFRPVLIGQGPSTLINRIDEQDLVRKGQKDALVMFLCAIKKDGGVEWSATYGAHTRFGFSQARIAEEDFAGR